MAHFAIQQDGEWRKRPESHAEHARVQDVGLLVSRHAEREDAVNGPVGIVISGKEADPLPHLVVQIGVIGDCADSEVLIVLDYELPGSIVQLNEFGIAVRPDVVESGAVGERELRSQQKADC